MSSGLLSLKWNNHNSTLLKLLSDLQSKCRFEDATVACGGKLYPVHRLVLSGCSRYFEQMFALMHGKHPIIVLKDIPCEVFEALLSYMYAGRVEVKKESLGELINAAACLEIKGLAVSEEYEGLSTNSSHSEASSLKRNGDHFENSQDRLSTSNKVPKLNHTSSINFENSPDMHETSNICAEQSSDLEETFLHDLSKSSSSATQKDNDADIIPEEGETMEQTPCFNIKINGTDVPQDTDADKVDAICENEPKECATVFDFEASTSDIERAEMVEAASLQQEQLDLALVDKKTNSSDSAASNEDISEFSTSQNESSYSTATAVDSHNFPVFLENGTASNTSYTSETIDSTASFDIYSMLDLHYDDATTTNDVDLSTLLLKSGFSGATSGAVSSHKSPILRQQWQCPQCDYSTPVKQYITQHIRRHTGEKPFKCNLCDYRAAQKQSVTYHMRRHTGEKPFKCPHCTYCSSSRQNLDRHVRRHTGEMPYGCPYCSYRSITKGPVVDHMRAKHGELECDKSLVLKLEAKNDGAIAT